MMKKGGGATVCGSSDEGKSEREKILSEIVQSLASSRENESWGLMVEASEDYQRTCYKLRHAALPEVKFFSLEEKGIFVKIGTALYHKSDSLQSLQSPEKSSTDTHEVIDTKRIYTALESFAKGMISIPGLKSIVNEVLVSCSATVDPTELSEQDKMNKFLNMSEDEYAEALEEAMEIEKKGTLIARKDTLPGYRYLDIVIDKIELKDPQNYTDPFITVSVKGLRAENIEDSQDSPVVTEREHSAVIFNTTVQIQSPLEEIPSGSAIFFEFKHCKPKKKNISTKCFSFMEMDEIKPGRTYLEIYKKPTDFRRKKLSLLSVKPLYLHLKLTMQRP